MLKPELMFGEAEAPKSAALLRIRKLKLADAFQRFFNSNRHDAGNLQENRGEIQFLLAIFSRGQQDLRMNRNQAALHGRTSSRFNYTASWFDVRVFYVRVMSCLAEEAPEQLTMWFPARSIDIALEVNGGRIAPSEEACIALRRDRLDLECEEVTYVSTDKLRTSGSLGFEIYDKQEFLASGCLKQCVIMPASADQSCCSSNPATSSACCNIEFSSSSTSPTSTSNSGSNLIGGGGQIFPKNRKPGWRMECSGEVGTSKCSSFVRVRHEYFFASAKHATSAGAEISKNYLSSNTGNVTRLSTCMEVCVVGRYMGSPVILTQTVQLNARRSRLKCAVLDAIPEDEECSTIAKYGDSLVLASDQEQLVDQLQFSSRSADTSAIAEEAAAQEFTKLYDEAGEAEEDGEVSWFNAGVRVGVGIGLGMCLGVGIGVGLFVRTYNITTRSFRRGIL